MGKDACHAGGLNLLRAAMPLHQTWRPPPPAGLSRSHSDISTMYHALVSAQTIMMYEHGVPTTTTTCGAWATISYGDHPQRRMGSGSAGRQVLAFRASTYLSAFWAGADIRAALPRHCPSWAVRVALALGRMPGASALQKTSSGTAKAHEDALRQNRSGMASTLALATPRGRPCASRLRTHAHAQAHCMT